MPQNYLFINNIRPDSVNALVQTCDICANLTRSLNNNKYFIVVNYMYLNISYKHQIFKHIHYILKRIYKAHMNE